MKLLLLILPLFFNNSALDKQVNNYLSRYLLGYEKFEYEVLSSPKGLSSYELVDDGKFNIIKNIVYIPVKTTNSKHGNTLSVVSVKVKLFKKVLVAVENIKSKTDLNESMFETRLVDVTSLRGTIINNAEILNSLRSKSFLNRGEILTLEEVESLPVLFSGDEVTAEKNFGSVYVTIQAFAREDGRIGDKIKIKTVDNKQFTAKILSGKKVYIEE